ncbi:MAG: hypothetical protein OXC40_06000 [Proteobacteria bacterium]|nr:hypothetical protein [Pseudomonadota bacterium]
MGKDDNRLTPLVKRRRAQKKKKQKEKALLSARLELHEKAEKDRGMKPVKTLKSVKRPKEKKNMAQS